MREVASEADERESEETMMISLDRSDLNELDRLHRAYTHPVRNGSAFAAYREAAANACPWLSARVRKLEKALRDIAELSGMARKALED